MKRRHLIAIAAMVLVFAFGVGVAVAFRQLGRARAMTSGSSKVMAASPLVTLITSPGTYRYDDLGLVLKVWVDTAGLVQYDLTSTEGLPQAHSTERASTYSRWAFVIDDKKRLWFYSGDVGTFVWDGSTDTSRHLPSEDPLRPQLPPALKQYAPRS